MNTSIPTVFQFPGLYRRGVNFTRAAGFIDAGCADPFDFMQVDERSLSDMRGIVFGSHVPAVGGPLVRAMYTKYNLIYLAALYEGKAGPSSLAALPTWDGLVRIAQFYRYDRPTKYLSLGAYAELKAAAGDLVRSIEYYELCYRGIFAVLSYCGSGPVRPDDYVCSDISDYRDLGDLVIYNNLRFVWYDNRFVASTCSLLGVNVHPWFCPKANISSVDTVPYSVGKDLVKIFHFAGEVFVAPFNFDAAAGPHIVGMPAVYHDGDGLAGSLAALENHPESIGLIASPIRTAASSLLQQVFKQSDNRLAVGNRQAAAASVVFDCAKLAQTIAHDQASNNHATAPRFRELKELYGCDSYKELAFEVICRALIPKNVTPELHHRYRSILRQVVGVAVEYRYFRRLLDCNFALDARGKLWYGPSTHYNDHIQGMSHTGLAIVIGDWTAYSLGETDSFSARLRLYVLHRETTVVGWHLGSTFNKWVARGCPPDFCVRSRGGAIGRNSGFNWQPYPVLKAANEAVKALGYWDRHLFTASIGGLGPRRFLGPGGHSFATPRLHNGHHILELGCLALTDCDVSTVGALAESCRNKPVYARACEDVLSSGHLLDSVCGPWVSTLDARKPALLRAFIEYSLELSLIAGDDCVEAHEYYTN